MNFLRHLSIFEAGTLFNLNQMSRKIRIKPYLHLLQHDTVVDVIKTLDEGAKLPAGEFLEGFLHTMQNLSDEQEIQQALCVRFGLPAAVVQQFISQLFTLGILEYYHPGLPADMNRYHRQLLFFDSLQPATDFAENQIRQKKIAEKHVLILGIGGIGNFIALSLCAAGVGRITLVDADVVEETNLNRQVLFDAGDLGQPKALAAARRLQQLNPDCRIAAQQQMVQSQQMLDELLLAVGPVDYLVLSADQPVDLVLWASALCPVHRFKYLKCGYMTYQGLIGPLLGPNTRPYEALFASWAENIARQPAVIQVQNAQYIAASLAAGNAILANIAALELLKDMTGVFPSVLLEKRLLLNMKTMALGFG